MELIFSISSMIFYLSSPFINFDSFLSSLQNINFDSYCQAYWTDSSLDEAAAIMLDKTFGLIYRTCEVLFLTPSILLIFLNFFLIEE